MTVTLSPQGTRHSQIAIQPKDVPQDGLRRWTPDEYHRMIEMDLFDGVPVELLSGGIWQVHTPDFHRWTPKQYHRLIESGFFDDGRVEMLEGLIWAMDGQLTLHSTGVRLATLGLEEVFAEGCEVRPQLPIVLLDGTEPEPDVTVALGTPFDYLDHHPGPDELLLTVEVSDSALAKDRGLKLTAYAKAGVVECWIVNLVQRQLEVYRQPSPAGIYTDAAIYQPGQSIVPLKAPDKPVAVADLLPPEPR